MFERFSEQPTIFLRVFGLVFFEGSRAHRVSCSHQPTRLHSTKRSTGASETTLYIVSQYEPAESFFGTPKSMCNPICLSIYLSIYLSMHAYTHTEIPGVVGFVF